MRRSRGSYGEVIQERVLSAGLVCAAMVSACGQTPAATRASSSARPQHTPPAARTIGIWRVSVGGDQAEGDDASESWGQAVSADGRFVAFDSRASNLVPGDRDANGEMDVFVRDRVIGTTELVSATPGGAPARGASTHAAISVDGRFVAFESSAPDVTDDARGEVTDVFVRDRGARATWCASCPADGRPANGNSGQPSISADGRYVAFQSAASSLVPGDANGERDVFVVDRAARTVVWSSVALADARGPIRHFSPVLSADGRVVVFHSFSTYPIEGITSAFFNVLVHDLRSGTTRRLAVGVPDQTVVLVSALSSNGRYVAFDSVAGDVVPGGGSEESQVYVHDRTTGTTTRVSLGPRGVPADVSAEGPSLSADGRFVFFVSMASNLVPRDTNGRCDVFVHDRETHATTRLSVTSDEAETAGQRCYSVSASADGRHAAFTFNDSERAPAGTSQLVPRDSNGASDVFVRTWF